MTRRVPRLSGLCPCEIGKRKEVAHRDNDDEQPHVMRPRPHVRLLDRCNSILLKDLS